MPISTALKTNVEARLTAMRANITARQNAYLTSKKRYFQGIETNRIPPADGQNAAPDKNAKPTDQPESWADAGFVLPAVLPMSVRIDTYDGPRGKGYVTSITVQEAGKLYTKCENVGPETWRAKDWAEVVQNALPRLR